MFNDALSNGIYTSSSFTGTLTAGSFVGPLNGNVTGTIIGTGGTISSLTTGTTTSTAANITNGTVQTLTASTANITQGSAILTQGTIATLNSTTGTIATLNSTTGTVATLNSTTGTIATLNSTNGTIVGLNSTNGTIANLSATTSTFLGAITGSTNVVNIGSGQIYKDGSGNVGIGKTPTNKLDILAASNTGITISNGTMTGVFANSADTSIVVGSQTSHAVNFYTNNLPRMQIDTSGNCLVVSAANLGYGSGSGGTVTQGTSKTTGVTLNKPTGQITMNNALLANAATVRFALTNSFISAVDILAVNATAFSGYTTTCENTATGAATIRVTNVSGGGLSEAVTLQFAVIKGSAT
jgi:hypothetical protein